MTPPQAQMLTIDDFLHLKENPQPYSRAAVARKLAAHIEGADKDSSEFKLACEIAEFLQRDKDRNVRISLAESLKQLTKTPLHIVRQLAEDDCDEVAIPILRYSPVITDSILFAIISATQQTARLIAVAERDYVSVTICEALIVKQQEPVTSSLLNNTKAEMNEALYDRVVQLHSNSKNMLHSLMKRVPMPMKAVNDMIAFQANSNQQDASSSRTLRSFTHISQEALAADIETLLRLGNAPSLEASTALARESNRGGHINAPFMILALCMGYEDFFYACLQQQTQMPLGEIKRLCQGNETDFKLLFNKSRISSSLFGLMWWTISGLQDASGPGYKPGTRRLIMTMSEHLIDAEAAGVNFAGTIGHPIASALLKRFQ